MQKKSKQRALTNVGRYACLDAEGVTTADAVVLCLTDDDYRYKGTLTECGIAIGSKTPVIAWCNQNANGEKQPPPMYETLFLCHPLVFRVGTWKEVLNALEFARWMTLVDCENAFTADDQDKYHTLACFVCEKRRVNAKPSVVLRDS